MRRYGNSLFILPLNSPFPTSSEHQDIPLQSTRPPYQKKVHAQLGKYSQTPKEARLYRNKNWNNCHSRTVSGYSLQI